MPTPFTLVYSAYFNDCTRAERFAHVFSDTKGYGLSNNRDFFLVPVQQAIDAVLQAKKNDGVVVQPDDHDEPRDSNRIADDFYEQAEQYYYGRDELSPGL